MGQFNRAGDPTGPKMKPPAPIFILLVAAPCSQGAFYNLQEDGGILCEKREDCPEDIPDKENSTVLQFRCVPRVSIDKEESEEKSGKEGFQSLNPEFLNQRICGEKTVNICCTHFSDPLQCEDFNAETCDEDNLEVFGGRKPAFQIANPTTKVLVTVPPKLRAKCDPQECWRTKRVRRRGVVDLCCELVIIRGNSACPPRRRGNCREL